MIMLEFRIAILHTTIGHLIFQSINTLQYILYSTTLWFAANSLQEKANEVLTSLYYKQIVKRLLTLL